MICKGTDGVAAADLAAAAAAAATPLHFGLEFLVQGLELLHVCLLVGPLDTQTFVLIRLRDLFK